MRGTNCPGKIMNEMFLFFPKVQFNFRIILIYRKKPLNLLKVSVSRCLTHGRASERVLDCLHGILEGLNKKCIDTNESEVKGYRNLLTDHKVLFCICLMADILKILNVDKNNTLFK